MQERLLRGIFRYFIRPRKIDGLLSIEILLQLQTIDFFARPVPALPFRKAPVPHKPRSAACFAEILLLATIRREPYLMRQHHHHCYSLSTLAASTSFLFLCEREPCIRAENTVMISKTSCTSYSSNEDSSP